MHTKAQLRIELMFEQFFYVILITKSKSWEHYLFLASSCRQIFLGLGFYFCPTAWIIYSIPEIFVKTICTSLLSDIYAKHYNYRKNLWCSTRVLFVIIFHVDYCFLCNNGFRYRKRISTLCMHIDFHEISVPKSKLHKYQ